MVTRPRTVAFIAAVLWWVLALVLAPTMGKLLLVPGISSFVLVIWLMLAAVASAVPLVEVCRAVFSLTAWSDGLHFRIVAVTSTALWIVFILSFIYGLGQGYA